MEVDLDDLEIEARIIPDFDCAGLHQIEVVALIDNESVCKLDAIRWTEMYFDIEDRQLLRAFDMHSEDSNALGEELHSRRKLIGRRFPSDEYGQCGFIGILEIRTKPEARGQRIGLELLRHLKEAHTGLAWFAGMRAYPIDFKKASAAEHQAMRNRLIAYYQSDPELGFQDFGTKAKPGLLVALWEPGVPTFVI